MTRAGSLPSWLVVLLASCSGTHEIGQYQGPTAQPVGGSGGGDSAVGGGGAWGGGGAGAAAVGGGAWGGGGGAAAAGGGAGGYDGFSGSAGFAGSAGASGASDVLIDDFEDGDVMLAEAAGRSGSWQWLRQQSYNCVQPSVAVLPPAFDSAAALQVLFDCPVGPEDRLIGYLNAVQGLDGAWQPRPYDASRWVGIGFMARAEVPSGQAIALEVLVTTTGSDVCDSCPETYSATTILPGQTWSVHQIPWYMFNWLSGSGVALGIPNPSRLESISFRTAEGGVSLSFDNLAFIWLP